MVIEILIKVFTLNFITYYISQKILKEDRIHYIKTIVVSILTTAIYMMLRKTIDDVIFLTIVQYLVQLIFIKMIIEDSSKNVLIGNLISNAITYVLWGIAGVIGFLNMILKINNIKKRSRINGSAFCLCKICYNIGAVTLSSRKEVRRMNDPLIALAVAVVAGVAVHYICKWLDGQ